MHLVRGLSLAQVLQRAEISPLTVPQPTTDDSRPPTASPASPPREGGECQPLEATPSEGADLAALPPQPTGECDPPALRAYREDRFRFLVRVGLQAARSFSANLLQPQAASATTRLRPSRLAR